MVRNVGNNIIKPDIENPSDYLLFLTSGRVVPRTDLNDQKRKKAMETIRVLNLDNDPTLINSRKQAINAISEEIQTLYGMKEEFENGWNELLDESLKELEGQEFQTALEHAWNYNVQYSTD